jgi:hypothetical protein
MLDHLKGKKKDESLRDFNRRTRKRTKVETRQMKKMQRKLAENGGAKIVENNDSGFDVFF